MPRKVVFIFCFALVCIQVPGYSANFMAGVRGDLNLATWYCDDVDFVFDKIALTLDVRYSLGMITLDGDKKIYYDRLAEIKNEALSIIGGLSWEN